MKKKLIVTAALASLAVLGLCACKGGEIKTEPVNTVNTEDGKNNNGGNKTDSTTEEEPTINTFIDADYYGCPNSNRIKKLNLKKKSRIK